MDWPMSQEEKKKRLMSLYDMDFQASEQLLKDCAQKLKEAEHSPKFQQSDRITSAGKDVGPGRSQVRPASTQLPSKGKMANPSSLQEERTWLWSALGALLGTETSGPRSGPAGHCEETYERCTSSKQLRAKSEDPKKNHPAIHEPASGCEPRKRRSRGGQPLCVSFEDEDCTVGEECPEAPEPEPQPQPCEVQEPQCAHASRRARLRDRLHGLRRHQPFELLAEPDPSRELADNPANAIVQPCPD